MTKIAIDVVLLPSEEMMDKAIKINEELLKDYENKIILHKENCLPHISLCMGCIDEKDLPKAKEILDDIANEFKQMDLVAEDIEAEIIPTGKKVSGLNIKKTDEVQKIHEIVMGKLFHLLTYNAEIEMVFNPPEVEEVTLFWIKNYSKKYKNPDKFHPHITVGFGETDKFYFPINFGASRLALCHLGNYCTCRKILFESKLSK